MTPGSALPTGVGDLPTESTVCGPTDAGIGPAVGAGVGEAVGDETRPLATIAARSSATEAAPSSATGSAWATTPGSAPPSVVGGLPTENSARGPDDAGIGTAVGAGVGAAVGDGVGMVVGDDSGKVVGDGSSLAVGDGIGVGDDAGIGTADRGWRLADRKHCAWTGGRRIDRQSGSLVRVPTRSVSARFASSDRQLAVDAARFGVGEVRVIRQAVGSGASRRGSVRRGSPHRQASARRCGESVRRRRLSAGSLAVGESNEVRSARSIDRQLAVGAARFGCGDVRRSTAVWLVVDEVRFGEVAGSTARPLVRRAFGEAPHDGS